MQKTKEGITRAELPIFIQWMDFLKWLLLTTDKFPKKARFTFSDRVNRLALDVIEEIIEAKYSRNKEMTLMQANLNLEKLRVLLRICYELRYLTLKSYEHAVFSINDVGKMLGGWIKHEGAAR